MSRHASPRPPAVESADEPGRAASYLELTKPGIAVFVMITVGVGYYLGVRGRIDAATFMNLLTGVLIATAGSLALNQYTERGKDAIMLRTRGRPIPSGRVTPGEALALGSLLFVGGELFLLATVGSLPAFLTALSAVAYIFVYTPLKSRSYAATPAGAVPGAMPVLIGWSAATGSVSATAMALFAIGYLWQLPHVLSLGWMLREDYARAGFYLIPPSDPEGRKIGRHLVLTCGLLIPVSLLPTFVGLTGRVYLVGALLLGLGFLATGVRAARHMTDANARRVFLASLAYHPLHMGLLVLDALPA